MGPPLKPLRGRPFRDGGGGGGGGSYGFLPGLPVTPLNPVVPIVPTALVVLVVPTVPAAPVVPVMPTVLARIMAASPDLATRPRTSSPATPYGLFEEPIDTTSCSHISTLLSDTAEREPVLETFRHAVAQRTHDALHSAKRRKVCYRSVLVARNHTNV